MKFLEELEQILILRKKELPEKSYTADLFKKGVDRILKKVGEGADGEDDEGDEDDEDGDGPDGEDDDEDDDDDEGDE
jgi:hypothetical protein